MKLEKYRRAKRIQEVLKKQGNLVSKREIYKEAFKEKLRKRLRERMRLQELEKKQSKTRTKKAPSKPS
ncbi:MAG: hypothetical protein J7K02_04800 [Deltaproteobacteria bacterium]|nr:hypothetical protein [Deltaproteobacteria bacterium]